MKQMMIKGVPKTLIKIVKGVPRFCKHNSNWILAALALLGVSGLTWAAIDGTIKAVKLCEEKEVHGAKEIIKTTWKLYIPMAGFFILTTVAIASNAHINAKKIATLTGLYAASQADIDSMRKKVKEMVGPKKQKEIEMEANKDRLPASVRESDIAQTGHGNQLFMDWLTGQYFRASPDYIELVDEKINQSIQGSVDNVLMRGYLQDKLHERDCGTKDLFWDLYELKTHGINEIKLDISVVEWVDVGGQREMCSVLKCIPEATGF